MTGLFYAGVRCTGAHANFCVFAELPDNGTDLVFNAFDPVKGRGRELARIPIDRKKDYNWVVSPDGLFVVAGVEYAEGTLQVRRTDGRPTQNLVIKGWPALEYLDFSADSRGLFMNSTSNGVGTLLYVALTGKAHPLWEPKSPKVGWGNQSRDGHHLAIAGESLESNVWMMKDF